MVYQVYDWEISRNTLRTNARRVPFGTTQNFSMQLKWRVRGLALFTGLAANSRDDLTQLIAALLSPEPGPVLADVHDHQRVQTDGDGADGARGCHDLDTPGHPRVPLGGVLVDLHRRLLARIFLRHVDLHVASRSPFSLVLRPRRRLRPDRSSRTRERDRGTSDRAVRELIDANFSKSPETVSRRSAVVRWSARSNADGHRVDSHSRGKRSRRVER